jgi:hypothetical protein
MKNRGATGRYIQTAFFQAEGELCLKVRSQPKNAAARAAQLELQSTGGDTQPSSERLTCRACYTPASPKTIQSP